MTNYIKEIFPAFFLASRYEGARADLDSRFYAACIDIPFISFVAAAIVSVPTISGFSVMVDPILWPLLSVLIASFLYHFIFENSFLEGTIGKYIFKLRTKMNDGRRMSVLTVFFRCFLRLFNQILFLIPSVFCMMLPTRLTIADYVTNTISLPKILIKSPSEFNSSDHLNLNKSLLSNSLIVTCLLIIILWIVLFSEFWIAFGNIRAKTTTAYESLTPLLAEIETYRSKNKKMPRTLDELGVKFNDPRMSFSKTIKTLDYQSHNGALIISFTDDVHVKGSLELLPIPGFGNLRDSKITWICSGSLGFLQSFLPAGCYTKLDLKQFRANLKVSDL